VNELQTWLLRLLQMPLRLPDVVSPVRLQDLSRYQAEMEFWFAAHQTDLQRLDKFVTKHTLGGRPRPPIQSSTLNGLLKGFMDLVFEHDGRYYVADYKSNWLGPDESHYTVEQLEEAIRSHRYDLQYALYLLALHRHLRTRLVDYDYDRHVGGAVYWFLRGIEHDSCGLHIEKPPKVLIETLDALFSGRERRAA
jgi:exodeoxyribonuclease V beta subunit